MAIPDANFKSYLTGAVGSDGGGAQNDPDSSLGSYRSTTEISLTVGNLFEEYSVAQLSASTRYRCVCLVMDHVSAVQAAARIVAEGVAALKANMTVTFGMMTNDTTTAAPTCTDTTTPAGITFFTPFDSTGDATSDYTSARPLGPLNTDSDGSTDLDFDDDKRVFLYVKIVCAGATGAFTDGVDNLIGQLTTGTDSI